MLPTFKYGESHAELKSYQIYCIKKKKKKEKTPTAFEV